MEPSADTELALAVVYEYLSSFKNSSLLQKFLEEATQRSTNFRLLDRRKLLRLLRLRKLAGSIEPSENNQPLSIVELLATYCFLRDERVCDTTEEAVVHQQTICPPPLPASRISNAGHAISAESAASSTFNPPAVTDSVSNTSGEITSSVSIHAKLETSKTANSSEHIAPNSTSTTPATSNSFWERLNASKSTQNDGQSANISSSSQAGNSFWERLNASKSTQNDGQSANVSSPSQTGNSFQDRLNKSHQKSPDIDNATSDTQSKGSFWDRLQASKNNAHAKSDTSVKESRKLSEGDSSDQIIDTKPCASGTKYTAPDGTTFYDRFQYRDYLFKNFYMFSDKSHQKLEKKFGEIDGQPFNLERLTDCDVLLLDHCDAIHAEDLTACRVFIASCSDSIFLRNCKNCTFTVACKQLRTRDCQDIQLNLYSKTDPIIETSFGMKFAPFNGYLPNLNQIFKKANLFGHANHWNLVFDFNKDDATIPRPHWKISQLETDWRPEVPEAGPELYEQPACVHTAVSETAPLQGLSAFDIHTTQRDAQASLT